MLIVLKFSALRENDYAGDVYLIGPLKWPDLSFTGEDSPATILERFIEDPPEKREIFS